MKFYTQQQAPAGNWFDSIGTNDFKSAQRHADYLASIGNKSRVIERNDIVISERAADLQLCNLSRAEALAQAKQEAKS